MGEAQHRARDSRLGSGDLHPVQQVRSRVPARRDPREGLSTRRPLDGAPPDFKFASYREDRASDYEGSTYTRTGRARGLHGMLVSAWWSARPRTSSNPRHKAIDDGTAGTGLRQAERAELPTSSSSGCPTPIASAVKIRQQGHRSFSSHCSSTPAPAQAAARRPTSSS